MKQNSQAKKGFGRAGDYIEHLDELVRRRAVRRVVLYGRESSRTQNRKGNLTDQMNRLRRYVEAHRVPIVAEFADVGSGWEIDRGRLRAAAICARRTGAVVVAESTDRFIRSKQYHSKRNPSAQPTVTEFETLKKATEGVTCVGSAGIGQVRWSAQ